MLADFLIVQLFQQSLRIPVQGRLHSFPSEEPDRLRLHAT